MTTINAGSFKKGEKRPNQGKRGPNKTTQIAKDAIATAAAELGGSTRLVEWAKEDPKNESAFWTTIYPKLLPLQITGGDGERLFPTTINVLSGKP